MHLNTTFKFKIDLKKADWISIYEITKINFSVWIYIFIVVLIQCDPENLVVWPHVQITILAAYVCERL